METLTRPAATLRRIALVVAGVGLFVIALGLMKSGAMALAPSLAGSTFTDGPWSALGLGWLGACMVLSGSPVAASALTLLDGGVIDRSEAFAMLTGSRLGASFVVLVVGFFWAIKRERGSGRRTPLSIGVMSLLMTACAYLPGAFVGWLLLTGDHLDGLNLAASPDVMAVTDVAFGWAVDLARAALPDWMLFPAGLGVLLGAFKLFDHVIPTISTETLEQRPDAWFRKPWLMFLTGCGVALLTMSVSVALTLLVPLVAKGHIHRKDALPYIAGANITTLADTLAAAVLLGNADAVRVVAAELIGVTAWTVLLLGLLYGALRPAILGASGRILAGPPQLVAFLIGLFSIPLVLVAL